MKTIAYFFTIISVALVSCSSPRYMYTPSAHNVPVLVKKGDSKLSASYSSNLLGSPLVRSSDDGDYDKVDGFDLQGAVAITNNIAVQANYFNRTESNHSSRNYVNTSTINYKRNLTEIGIGYFKSMHRKDRVIFQIFGGVGKGSFSFTDKGINSGNVSFTKHHQANVFKVYAQPAFLFRIKENFSMSVSTRISVIRFNQIKTDYSARDLEYYNLNELGTGSYAFWEPAFTNTFGFKKLRGVKFEYQLGTALRVSDYYIDYRSFNVSLGVVLDIPKILQPAASER